MRILGLSCFYHDSAAAILNSGLPVAAAQEERFSRIKNDPSFPSSAIQFCLNQADIKLSKLDAVVFYEKPLLKLDRLIDTFLKISPRQIGSFVDSFFEATNKTIFLRSQLTQELKKIDADFDENRLLFSEHHLSHASSAFFPSPFEKAVVLTMDGLGEWATTAISLGEENSLSMIKEIHFPHSLGLFYSTLTAFCGFKVNSGEYKLMGLAPYGTPRFFQKMLDELITLRDDGSFRLNLKYFNFSSTKTMFNPMIQSFFGTQPRLPESHIESIYMDIASSTQAVLDAAVLNITENLSKNQHSPNLCMAGGVALNCVTNSKIVKKGHFENIWVQPASGDAGGALGAALAAHSLHFKQQRYFKKTKDSMSFAYLGTEYNNAQIKDVLDAFKINYQELNEAALLEMACQFLLNGKTLGWFQGKMEFGPRALGSRSILADARVVDMQKKLNLQVKFRESFRPFAPIVLQEKYKEWFEGIVDSSPYMLFVDEILPAHQIFNKEPYLDSIDRLHRPRSKVPAITHLDYSARVQTVSEDQNLLLHKLISLFDRQTGVPILINTSFNVRGEPIVESPEDALLCFLKTDLDALFIGHYLVEKRLNLSKIKENTKSKNLD